MCFVWQKLAKILKFGNFETRSSEIEHLKKKLTDLGLQLGVSDISMV